MVEIHKAEASFKVGDTIVAGNMTFKVIKTLTKKKGRGWKSETLKGCKPPNASASPQ